MSDVILLWDSPLLFEKLFLEYGLECTRVLSTSIGTPYLPPCKIIIIPTGFGNENYTKTGPGIERNKRAFGRFVEKGGVLLVFSPLVPEYDYEWLPFKLKYVMEENSCTPRQVGEHEAQKLVEGVLPPVGCDGYFSETGAEVVLEDEKGRPVMVVREAGEGLVVATTIHELPANEFFKCRVCGARKVKI
ncbi:MAG: hypothetical protein PHV51_04160 [Methanosarcinaceae archaeon]|nr:hypothetical protein [Methanosarcinaceae archaeon]MDD4497331.1 hypothetical protein [Methanosarcinaceae archaeon]